MDKDKINKINKFAICLFCKTFLMIDSISISDTDSIYLCYHCECGINRRMRLDKYLYGLNFIHNINLSLRSIHLCLDCFKTAYCDDKHHKNHTKIRKYYTLRNYEDCSSHQIFKEYVCLQCKIDICDECLKTTHKDHQHLTIRNYYDQVKTDIVNKQLCNINCFLKQKLNGISSKNYNAMLNNLIELYSLVLEGFKLTEKEPIYILCYSAKHLVNISYHNNNLPYIIKYKHYKLEQCLCKEFPNLDFVKTIKKKKRKNIFIILRK